MVSEEIILNSYIVEQEAWDNRDALGPKLLQVANWSSTYPVVVMGSRIDYMKWSILTDKVHGIYNDDGYVTTLDGKTWTSPVTLPAYVRQLPTAENDTIAIGAPTYSTITEMRNHNFYYTTNMTSFTEGEILRCLVDQESCEYTSTVADEQMGWSVAYTVGTGMSGAPVYNSSQGRCMFNDNGTHTQVLASDGVVGDGFGYSIASVVDMDPLHATPNEWFLVGAPGGNAAYEFKYKYSYDWNETAIIAPPSTPGASGVGLVALPPAVVAQSGRTTLVLPGALGCNKF
jgi:hypothetical protein